MVYSTVMGVFEVFVTRKGKRPDYATPALARKLRAEGKSVVKIAEDWGITRSQVYNILKQGIARD